MGVAPDPLPRFNFDIISLYVSLIRHLRPSIKAEQHSHRTSPPNTLPARLHHFVRGVLGVDDHTMAQLWGMLKDAAWNVPENEPAALAPDLAALLPLFIKHGIPFKVGK